MVELKRFSNSKFPLWIVILALGTLFFLPSIIVTSPDSAWYLTSALNIYHGRGYVDAAHRSIVERGVFFPALIAISFYLFGPSVEAAAGVVKLFFILNLLITYALGAKLYDRKIGFTASILVLTSPLFLGWSSCVILDIVVSFFMLAFLYFTYLGYQKETPIYHLLAGLVLGLAFLTKEMTVILVFLPLAIPLLIVEFRKRTSFIKALTFYFSFLLTLLPWSSYAYFKTGDMVAVQWLWRLVTRYVPGFTVWGSAYTSAFDAFDLAALVNFSSKPGLYLGGPEILVMLCIWVLSLYKAARKSAPDIFIVLSAAIFFPVIMFTVGLQKRSGNLAYFCLLSYIVGANLLYFIASQISSYIGAKCHNFEKWSYYFLVYGILIFLSSAQLGSYMYFVRAKHFPRSGNVIAGWHNDSVRAIGKWIAENIPTGANILCEWYWLDSLYFFDKGNHKFRQIQLIGWREKSKVSVARKRKILFLQRNRKAFMCLTEHHLLKVIKRKSISYVIITPRRSFLSAYFDNNPNFEELKEFHTPEGITRVFKVQGTERHKDFRTIISLDAKEYMRELTSKYPLRYRKVLKNFFWTRLGFTQKDVEQLFAEN